MIKTLSGNLDGFNINRVEVESTFTRGLPAFSIVGLANSAIQESRDRIKSALLVNSFKFPPMKITINLSPSDIKKSGSHFDLPIALSIALQKLDIEIDLERIFIFGELGLDGTLKDTNSIFAIVLTLFQRGELREVLVPKQAIEKLSKIPNLKIYGVQSLSEAIEFSLNREKFSPVVGDEIDLDSIEIAKERFYFNRDFKLNFSDVKGQNIAKRGALIASAGFHNILFEGSPGSGKSMIAKRLRYTLPPLNRAELLEIAKLNSLESSDFQIDGVRNFRSPHHSSTRSSIFGGGSKVARVGEIALANLGVLFFDELPYFDKQVLEALREPLEDNRVLISRVNSKVEYKTNFLFISAQNPCPCGNLLSKTKECRCSAIEIKRYRNRLSEPLLDRVDIFIQMSEISADDKSSVSSEDMFEEILKVFKIQKERGQVNLNGKMSEAEIEEFCKLNRVTKPILDRAIDTFSLSFRSINKVLKLSRTVADLDSSKEIEKRHLIEALSYRRR